MPFQFQRTEIPDVLVITPRVFPDDRGYFEETYKRSDFARHGIDAPFLQDNCSLSKKGVVRGLHYQIDPASQGKLLRVLAGSLWEVAVDIRRGSPYFGKWTGVLLSAENKKLMWIPAGFAAGMVSLEDGTELEYKTTQEYSKPHERGILWSDPEIGIRWPVAITDPIVSDKDRVHPPLRSAEINFDYAAPREPTDDR